MGLTVVLTVAAGETGPRPGPIPGPVLWPLCRDLAAGLQPGDQLVCVRLGPCPALDRFAEERGWGEGVEVERLDLDPGTDPATARAAARRRARHPVLHVEAGDRVGAPALAGLSRRIGTGEARGTLWIVNHLWQGMGPSGWMPCADAGRWPAAPGPADAETALGLLPDPRRLVGPDADADAGDYDTAVAGAAALQLWPAPVVARPRPASRATALLAAGPGAMPPGRWLTRVADQLPLVDPAEAPALAAAARAALVRLPRRERAAASARPDAAGRLMAAARRRDPAPALAEIALICAAESRALTALAAARIAALEAELELAVPGPEDLRAAYEWLRRP